MSISSNSAIADKRPRILKIVYDVAFVAAFLGLFAVWDIYMPHAIFTDFNFDARLAQMASGLFFSLFAFAVGGSSTQGSAEKSLLYGAISAAISIIIFALGIFFLPVRP